MDLDVLNIMFQNDLYKLLLLRLMTFWFWW